MYTFCYQPVDSDAKLQNDERTEHVWELRLRHTDATAAGRGLTPLLLDVSNCAATPQKIH